MVKDNDYDYIVVDQFEPEKSYYNHLSDVPNPLKGITFITKAEDKCLSVAVSSLISRYIFIKEMDKLTLEDSFRELIKQRKWYVNSLRSPIQAKYDKATFQKGGKVPEERIRDYLAAAGWKCVQPELWEKT